MSKVYDLIGVGFGPANIALSALLDETGQYQSRLFLERSEDPMWQSEMLFENSLDVHSNVQNIPHRDLATLRSPRSRYTFLNYLHETGRLLEHLNMDLLMPMRPDFAAYIRWVADQLSHNCRTGVSVRSVSMLNKKHSHVYRIETDDDVYLARHIVLGTGRPPLIPQVFESAIQSDRIFHLNRYKSACRLLLARGAQQFAVIGSSQSAVEMILHLSKFEPRVEVHSIFRRFGYPLKDTNPFMSEIYFPEFTDLFFSANPRLKKRINRDVVRTNYGACDMDVLEELYRQIYYDKMHGTNKIYLHRMSDVEAAEADSNGVTLVIRNGITNELETRRFDGVFLATGFRNIGANENGVKVPPLLEALEDKFDLDDQGCVQISRDYQVAMKHQYSHAGAVVLNGLCEASHGMGDAGSVSLLSLRALTITEALVKQDGSVTEYASAEEVALS
jgi:L-ornithine N5-oxygenase